MTKKFLIEFEDYTSERYGMDLLQSERLKTFRNNMEVLFTKICNANSEFLDSPTYEGLAKLSSLRREYHEEMFLKEEERYPENIWMDEYKIWILKLP